MFEHLQKFNGVLVTGPHRSGTTITGRMIAHDLERLYCTESQIQDGRRRFFLKDVMQWVNAQQGPWVLHGATCWRWVLELQSIQSLATVFVMRDVAEIQASQRKAGKIIDNPSEKQGHWQRLVDAGWIKSPFTVQYAGLKSHPLWVEDRSGWATRQITPTENAFNTKGGKCL